MSTPKTLEEFDGVDETICEFFSDIFLLAKKMDFLETDFIEKFMISDFCQREHDQNYSVFQMSDAEDNMDFILKEIKPLQTKEHIKDEILEWVGYSYKYIQIRTGLSSKEIYKKIPIEDMLIYYEGMHTQDYEYFLDCIKDKFKG